MLQEMLSSVRQARRFGQTSLAINKLAIQWLRSHDNDEFPYRLRDTMQELGSTYIKLGQLIASSPTLFPDAYVDAFQTCLDQTEPLPWHEVEPVLEQELGHRLNSQFKYIEKKALASASIAQVHAAVLKTGEEVVIKIQKPDVKQTLETDFQFLNYSTVLIEMINPKAWKSSVKDIVSEIRNGMLEECDFLQEAENIEEFRRFLDDFQIEQIVVPKVYPEFSTEKVLVMERFFGVPINDTEGVRRITSHPETALMQALDTWFMSLKECQIYHADLHAGNVMMLEDGRIGFIDFGIVGRLSPDTWEGITSLAVCVPAGDFHGLAVALSKIGATRHAPDIDQFAKDLEQLWQHITDDSNYIEHDNESFWRALTVDISTLGTRHGIRFPREFTLLVKQFLYFDRYIRLLAPEVDMFDPERMDLIGIDI